MNENLYKNAERIIKNSTIWIDDKSLLTSVISRARYLEKEVMRKQEEINNLQTEKMFKEAYDDCDAIDISEIEGWKGYEPID